MAEVENLVEFVARRLRDVADPERAPAMAAYLKTEMPFYGVSARDRRAVAREAARRYPPRDREEYEAMVRALWSRPHREERYVALALARAHGRFVAMESLPLYRDLIVEGAWWDLVDEVAVHLVGRLWHDHPEGMGPTMDRWVREEDRWLRRTALIGQNRRKEATDADRLFGYCALCVDDRDVFIRKAIGWALREYSKTDPDGVRDFLLANRERLSGLSFREGARRLQQAGLMTARAPDSEI
jgi:3-methyladenine DNA glycosylase AlkD